MAKYKNKYRVPSARAHWWEYHWEGAYFITICTENREHFFGKIMDGNMDLSPVGAIADVLWHELKKSHPNIELGDFVVMPNHVHGILIINPPAVSSPARRVNKEEIRTNRKKFMTDISPPSGSLAVVVRSYKGAVTRHARRLGYKFGWQTRFYDRIIRDDTAYQHASDYIVNNPANWEKDEHY